MRLILITFVFLMFTLARFADYSIDWYTIDGGGGKSSGAKALRVNFYYF